MKSRVNILLLVVVCVCAASLWHASARDRRGTGGLGGEPADEKLAKVVPPAEGLPAPWLGEGGDYIHLVILNGTETPGLAQDISLALNLFGCVTQRLGNAPHTAFERTLLVNRRLTDAQAAELAGRLGGVAWVTEKDSRTHEDALLVLGADYRRIQEALGIRRGMPRNAN